MTEEEWIESKQTLKELQEAYDRHMIKPLQRPEWMVSKRLEDAFKDCKEDISERQVKQKEESERFTREYKDFTEGGMKDD